MFYDFLRLIKKYLEDKIKSKIVLYKEMYLQYIIQIESNSKKRINNFIICFHYLCSPSTQHTLFTGYDWLGYWWRLFIFIINCSTLLYLFIYSLMSWVNTTNWNFRWWLNRFVESYHSVLSHWTLYLVRAFKFL